jgi:hypothetical protein
MPGSPQADLETDAFYPQVIGTDLPGNGTDRRAGKRARLFVHGVSDHVLRFKRPR